MFLKEFEAALIPWWLLFTLLTGDQGIWRWPMLMLSLYIVLTEVRYRMAVRESRSAGFLRMVRIPANPWLLRIILWRRMTIPGGVRCYTLHVHGKPESHRRLLDELLSDIVHGEKEPVVYIGNTFYDLGEFAKRHMKIGRVQIIRGTLFGRWLQTWRMDKGRWRIVKIDLR